jgi:rhodanese-related sulfurtransferase
MIAPRTTAAGVAVLLMAACAPQTPPAGKPVAREIAAKETTAKPAVRKKPVRMNGRGKVSSISIEDLFPLQESGKALIYDARPAFFYRLGHIPGAISLPKSDADARIEKRKSEIESALAAGKTIVVYCTNTLCPDARTVANHLAGYGYNSSVLSGGWDHYKEAGLPVE